MSPPTPLFAPVLAASNISSLDNRALAALPPGLAWLAPDMRPAASDVHGLGYGGYAWRDSQGVCIWMHSGSGGCFQYFTKPAVMYLSGTSSSSGDVSSEVLEGVVPDSVRDLVVKLDGGRSQAARIEQNAFYLDLQPGDAVLGETVTLKDGTSFVFPDPLSTPRHGG